MHLYIELHLNTLIKRTLSTKTPSEQSLSMEQPDPLNIAI